MPDPSVAQLQVKVLDSRYGSAWELPTYATHGSAAMDLRAAVDESVSIAPGDAQLIPSGLSIYVQNPDLCAVILPRSGLGHMHGLVLGNGTGLIDSDYQGPLMISVFNRSRTTFVIEPGDRIAQLMILPIVRPVLAVVDEFVATDRGAGGFGHTGKE